MTLTTTAPAPDPAPAPTPVPTPRATRVPLSALPLAAGEDDGPLGVSPVLAAALRHPRHPGVASGSTAAVNARVTGALGLPFVVDHRTTPDVRAAVGAYRAAFVAARPDPASGAGDRPVVLVVADTVVAPTATAARALAGPDAGRFVGSASDVVAGLDVLAAVTRADEVLVTSTAVGEADRARGRALLAARWSAR